MNEEYISHLASIRRGIWAILSVLLLMLGYDHTPFGKSELGATIAFIGLITGIIMIISAIVVMVFQFLMKLKDIADGEDNSQESTKQNKSCEATGDNGPS